MTEATALGLFNDRSTPGASSGGGRTAGGDGLDADGFAGVLTAALKGLSAGDKAAAADQLSAGEGRAALPVRPGETGGGDGTGLDLGALMERAAGAGDLAALESFAANELDGAAQADMQKLLDGLRATGEPAQAAESLLGVIDGLLEEGRIDSVTAESVLAGAQAGSEASDQRAAVLEALESGRMENSFEAEERARYQILLVALIAGRGEAGLEESDSPDGQAADEASGANQDRAASVAEALTAALGTEANRRPNGDGPVARNGESGQGDGGRADGRRAVDGLARLVEATLLSGGGRAGGGAGQQAGGRDAPAQELVAQLRAGETSQRAEAMTTLAGKLDSAARAVANGDPMPAVTALADERGTTPGELLRSGADSLRSAAAALRGGDPGDPARAANLTRLLGDAPTGAEGRSASEARAAAARAGDGQTPTAQHTANGGSAGDGQSRADGRSADARTGNGRAGESRSPGAPGLDRPAVRFALGEDQQGMGRVTVSQDAASDAASAGTSDKGATAPAAGGPLTSPLTHLFAQPGGDAAPPPPPQVGGAFAEPGGAPPAQGWSAHGLPLGGGGQLAWGSLAAGAGEADGLPGQAGGSTAETTLAARVSELLAAERAGRSNLGGQRVDPSLRGGGRANSQNLQAGTGGHGDGGQAGSGEHGRDPGRGPGLTGLGQTGAPTHAGTGQAGSAGWHAALQTAAGGVTGASAGGAGDGTQQERPPRPQTRQVAGAIHRAVAGGQESFTIRLNPPELGRVDVRMEIGQDSSVRAQLTVERSETLELLRNDARALERALQEAGLNADQDSLDFQLKDQGEQDGGRGQPGGRDGTGPEDGADDEDGADNAAGLRWRDDQGRVNVTL